MYRINYVTETTEKKYAREIKMLNENENFEKKKEKTLLHNGARSEEEKSSE